MMEWQKTTFGELKKGEIYAFSDPATDDCDSLDFICWIRGKNDGLKPRDTVYRLVFPEREALEAENATLRTRLDALVKAGERVDTKIGDAMASLEISTSDGDVRLVKDGIKKLGEASDTLSVALAAAVREAKGEK